MQHAKKEENRKNQSDWVAVSYVMLIECHDNNGGMLFL
jgi:hypothetical protein